MTENKNVNIPLLKQAVEWVETQAEIEDGFSEWYQGDWVRERACGTSYCVAGYIGQMLNPEYRGHVYPGDDSSKDHVSLFAAKMLGLVEVRVKSGEYYSKPGVDLIISPEGNGLFSGNNSAEDVRRIAEEIAGQPL